MSDDEEVKKMVEEWWDYDPADEWEPTAELRFVRRPVRFAGHAEPAFRLVLQQKWVYYPDYKSMLSEMKLRLGNGDPDVLYQEEWRDVPTVNEPDPMPMRQGVEVPAEKAA